MNDEAGAPRNIPNIPSPSEDAHECGWDYDPSCDGCRVAMHDAGDYERGYGRRS